jgi:hypothetical protein
MKGSTAPFANADGFSSQTPASQVVAVKSLILLRTAGDPNPVEVFDLGSAPVETDFITGAATRVASVPRASLPAGTFTVAKVGIAYVRYAISGRLHAAGMSTDGTYENVEALSDGAVIGGQARSKGYFQSSFSVAGATYATTDGATAPLPVATTAGGISMDTSGAVSFYVFPVTLTIDPTAAADVTVTFEANVDHSFRWQDEDLPDYAAGVFDTTPTTYESVTAFGANAFTVTSA